MAENTSLTTFSMLGVLGLLSGAILSGLAGVPAIGTFLPLLLGIVFVGAGVKTFDFDISEVEDVGGVLVSIGVAVLGASLVLTTLNLNILGFIPAWLTLGAIALGIVAVNWHWAESLLKM